MRAIVVALELTCISVPPQQQGVPAASADSESASVVLMNTHLDARLDPTNNQRVIRASDM